MASSPSCRGWFCRSTARRSRASDRSSTSSIADARRPLRLFLALLGLLPFLGRLTRRAHPRPQQHDALRIAPKRPRDHLVRSAPWAAFGLLARMDFAGEPGDLGFHARDYTRIRA